MTGGGAIVFAELIKLAQWLAIGSTDLPLYVLPHLPWYHVLLIPAVGGLLVAPFVFLTSHDARGHGVPEVIESISFKGGKIRAEVAVIKSLASAITIGTGGSVGREGPIVQIGAALGSALGQLLRVPTTRLPTLAGCGVAGGIAAVFNAPIAGAFFALEVIMGNFAMPAFGPVMLSSVVATVVSRAYFGDHPAFVVPGYTLVSAWELPLYLLLGIACGVGGLVFMFVLDTFEEQFAKLPIHNLLKPAVGGLILGAIILFVPNVYGIGYATMNAILRSGIPWPWLLLLLPVKMAATSLTLASGGSGGLFLPMLYLGSVTGGLFGFCAGVVFPSFTGPSGVYALVGMGAFLAGAVHCPITAFLLLFEITGDYRIILPLMVSCSVSTLVAKLWREESIYTLQLLRRGIDVRQREANLMQVFTVGHVMRREAPTLRETASFAEVVQHFLTSNMSVCFVVNHDRQLLGEISIHDVKELLQDDTLGPLVIAKDLAQPPNVTTSPDETLARCLDKFTLSDQEYLPVVSPTLELYGSISHRDVLDLYNREILRQEYLGLSLRSEVLRGTVHEQVRLPHEYIVEVVQIPPHYVGKTLRDTQLRTRFNLTAVAIRRGSFNGPDELPDPGRTFNPRDHLVLVGRASDMQRFTTEDLATQAGL
ncbi:MAG TPA: chloride channel protein [Candidatus Binatia bacterium]|nr:chloride channel protein [Candidatus Binatia bacterium]